MSASEKTKAETVHQLLVHLSCIPNTGDESLRHLEPRKKRRQWTWPLLTDKEIETETVYLWEYSSQKHSGVGILESAKNARSTIKTAFWSLYRRRITRLRAFCEKLKAFLRNAIGVSMTKWGVKEPLSRPQTCAKCVFRGWNHEVFRVVKSPEIGDIADYWRAQTVVKLGLLSSLRMYWTYAFVCDWIVK